MCVFAIAGCDIQTIDCDPHLPNYNRDCSSEAETDCDPRQYCSGRDWIPEPTDVVTSAATCDDDSDESKDSTGIYN